MIFQDYVFYALAAILLLAGLRVITTRNPVHAALYLVLAFFTAAGIWLTAGVGVTVGLGHWGLASIGALLTWLILAVLFKLEPETKHRA